MGALLGPDFPSDIGLAVSGGGDSMAMLTLAHNWTRVWGVRLWVVTVNHGLRDEAAAEAQLVAETCAELGHPHATLRWQWDGQGNVMDAARRARLRLIDAWRGTLAHVLMAHTADDVAETFVMRLARGSGVDGLSAMAAARTVDLPNPKTLGANEYSGTLPQQWTPRKGTAMRPARFQILRPCLEMTRAELRHYLRTLKGTWIEDPTNDDPSYDRARVRRALSTLSELGIDPATLTNTAHRMARARSALRARAVDVWSKIGTERDGHRDKLIDRDGFAAAERDTQMRILAAVLQFISGNAYRPRAAPLEALLDRLLAGGGGTLHGCEARAEPDHIRVFREYAAVAGVVQPLDAGLWDGCWRFRARGMNSDGLEIRALGDAGWEQLPPEHRTHLHAAARSLPALWRGATLVGCPGLGFGTGVFATLCPMGREGTTLIRFLNTH